MEPVRTGRQSEHHRPRSEALGCRTFYDKHRGFNAYLIQSPHHRVLYGGDSAYTELYKDVNGVDLAILGIGAYDPYIAAHTTPEQALAMADHAKARFIFPIHHSTFRLSHEPTTEPMQRLLAAADLAQDRVVIREVGQQWALREPTRPTAFRAEEHSNAEL